VSVGDSSLVSAMVSLAAKAAGDDGVDTLMTRLVDTAVAHLDVDGAGVMVNEGGLLRFVYSSHIGVEGADMLQQLMQDGPCHDAALFHVDVVVDDLTDPVQTAWPDYVERALQAGFRSVVAVPLVSGGRVWGTLDLYRRQEGTWTPQELEWVRLLANVAVSYLVIAADRDEARRAQRELVHASTHDALTGLPNRLLLFDRLDHALQTSRRHRRVVAVLFIDLDRFKAINDTFGHAAGDLVLTTVAARVSRTLRRQDTLSRLAGDEFVLVCEDLPQDDPAQARAHVDAVVSRLQRVLAQPIRVEEVDLVVSASIGVASSDGHDSADDLIADADRAMYLVKHHGGSHRLGDAPSRLPGRGGGGAAGASPRPHHSVRRLERELAQALPEQQLRLHYQPITDATGAVHAVEALLRWQHPTYGLLPASDFIDLATTTGMIVGMGHWVIAEACAQMARWHGALLDRAPATAYVNLSAGSASSRALTTTISTALEDHGLLPEHLGLELLETSFVDPQILPVLHEQHRRGHPLSVDDFGTGYSSLSRLVELPVQMAKIDKSLVTDIGRDARRRALVDAVVTVAGSLDLRVIAEGVETPAQARAVVAAGCHYLQGYHCGRPQPADALSADWLA
jgi:diguanylate cyclase (GGDEF)-like protein